MGSTRKKQTVAVETSLSPLAVTGRSFSTFLERPLLYLVLGLLSVLPAIIVENAARITPLDPHLAVRLLNMICGALISAAMASAVFQSFLGRELGLMEALGEGLASFANLAILALLVNILIFLGALLLIFPGVIVACMCFVAVPVCVVETRPPTDSAIRSINLTHGYRLNVLPFIIIYFAGIFFLPKLGVTTAKTFFAGNETAGIIIADLFLVPLNIYYGLAAALSYSDLRLIKEGVTADMLATDES